MAKKIVLSLLALCSFAVANAQAFRFGPTVAGSMNVSDGTKSKIGFAVGAKAEMEFNKTGHGWFMDASVLLNNRNRQSEDYFDNDTKTDTTLEVFYLLASRTSQCGLQIPPFRQLESPRCRRSLC